MNASERPPGRSAGLRRVGSALSSLPQHWRWGIGAFLVYRLLLSLWAALLWWLNLVPHSPQSPYYFGLVPLDGGLPGALIGVWQRWDAIHYARIAAHGYEAADLSAFHPLFPLLGGALGRAFEIEPTVALMLVANLSLGLGLVFLFRLVELEFGDSVSRGAILSLLAFPGAFFLAAPYAESLTLLLVVLSIRWARESRWGAAWLAGVGAGLAHFTSVPLTAMLLVEAARQGSGRFSLKRLARYGGAVGPLMGTGLFLAWRAAQGFGDWAATHRQLWGVVIRWPWEQIAELGEVFRSPYFALNGWANLLTMVLALAACLWWLRHRRGGWAAYLGVMVIMLLSIDVPTEPLASWIRHVVVLPPLFVTAGHVLAGGRWRLLALLAGAAAQLYFSALFVRWIWVA